MNETINPSIAQQPQFLPPASRLFGWTLSFYRSHFALIFGISLVPAILGVMLIFVVENTPVLPMILLIITFTAVAFISRLALFAAVTTEEEQSFTSAYKKGLQMLIPSIWINSLIVLATLGGLFLFIIPGIVLSILLSLSLYILFAENRRGTSALVLSWHYVKGYWGAIFGRILFLALIILLFSLVFVFVISGPSILTSLKNGVEPEVSLLSQAIHEILNNFLLLPLSIIYIYGIYRSLKEIKASVPLESDEQKIKKNIKIFYIIGIIGIMAMITIPIFLLIKFLPSFSPQLPSPTSFQIPASSMMALMVFSPLLDLMSFGK